jgi:hypothetical protein
VPRESALVDVSGEGLAAGQAATEAQGKLRPSVPRESALVDVSGEPLAAGQPATEAQRKLRPSVPRESAAEEISRERLMAVRASRCGEGGVVFDQDGRVLALCIPDAHSKTGTGAAIPIRRGLVLSGGAADDQDK